MKDKTMTILHCLAAALIIAGIGYTFGIGAALIAAGVMLMFYAMDRRREQNIAKMQERFDAFGKDFDN